MNATRLALNALVTLLMGNSYGTASGRSAADSYALHLERDSSTMHRFQAEFDAVSKWIPLPEEDFRIKVQQRLDQLREYAERVPAKERKIWLNYQRTHYLHEAEEERAPLTERGRARLVVDGRKFYWSGIRLAIAYNGKELFVLTRPLRNTVDRGFGVEKGVPGLHISARFCPLQAQHVPFYGLLHSMVPMFTLTDLRNSPPVAQMNCWRVGPTGRYGGPTPGLVRFDDEGHVREFRIYVGEPKVGNANLLERWSFLNWKRLAGGGCPSFPTKIAGDWFTIPPLGLGDGRRTRRQQHLELSLVSFTTSPPVQGIFSIWRPPIGSLVRDARYNPPRQYLFGEPGSEKGIERHVSHEQAVRVGTLVVLLLGLAVLQVIRSGVRRSVGQSSG